MRRTKLGLVCLSLPFMLVVALVSGENKKPETATDDAARAAAIKLFKSLTDEQKELALKDFDDKDRYAEVFPAAERKGLPYSKLTKEQVAMVDEIVKAMTSEYGAARCLEVAKQTGAGQRYINFFGEPSAEKAFAWRLAQHHLTLIYSEFGKEKAGEFGPVLLGGNPVNTLWDEEEKSALELHAGLTEDEAKKIVGKGNGASGAAIGDSGLKIKELSEKPRVLAKQLLQKRLEVFSPDRRKQLEALIEKDGGVDNLRIAFWGNKIASHKDGGNYNWKIGSPTVLCDWQTAGKNHIHMTVRGREKKS